VSVFKSTNNGQQECFNFGISVVVPASLTGQALAAALLKLYFQEEQQHPGSAGCGGMTIDAYNTQSQANPNGPNDGVATAGAVLLVKSETNPKNSVSVDLGPAYDPTDQFSFSY